MRSVYLRKIRLLTGLQLTNAANQLKLAFKNDFHQQILTENLTVS